MAGGAEDAATQQQEHGGRKRSRKAASSRCVLRDLEASRRDGLDNDDRIIYQDDPKRRSDGNLRRSWFDNFCRRCRCCGCGRNDGSSGSLERTKSEGKNLGYMEADDDIYRKMCIGTLFAFIHLLLALLAVFATYSMVKDLITSMKNPVRSVHYRKVTDYEAPGEYVGSND